MQKQNSSLWTLINVKGEVRVRVSGADWKTVDSGQSFSSNHSAGILTGEDGSLEVRGDLGETVQISPKSLMVFQDKTWSRVESVAGVGKCRAHLKKRA